MELASLERRRMKLEDLLVAAKDLLAEDRSGLQGVLKRLLMALGDEAIHYEEIVCEVAAE